MENNIKIILFMAMSLDWYIQDKDKKTPWSDFDWENYKNKVSEIQNIIIWYNTYEVMKKDNEFEFIWNPITFIFTNKNIEDYWNFIFVKSYKNFLDKIKKFKFNKFLLAWWTKLNTYFIENNLVNELIIDIEPFIFWWWLKLFDNISKNKNLKLLNTKKYWNLWTQVSYKINLWK